MLRPFRSGLVLLLPALLASAASAQSLSEVIAMKLADVVQTSATQESTRGYGFGAYASFAGTVPTSAVVTMQAPNGTTLQLSRLPDGTFSALQEFASKAETDAAYPDGTYKLTATNAGTVLATATFAFTSGRDVPPTLITDYDALQGAPSTAPTVAWQPIAGATAQDFLSLDISRADGTDVYTSPDQTLGNETSLVPHVINQVPLTGDLTYGKLAVATPTNGGPLVGTGTGFNLEFSLSCNAQPPVIWQSPVGADLMTGEGYTLQVNATAADAPLYRWYKNGVLITGARDSTYYIGSAQPADAGTYSVVAWNDAGAVTSDNAVISVSPAKPTITTQPLPAAVLPGGAIDLSVSAYWSSIGTGTLTYQWYKDGTALPGATAATYSVAAAQPSDAGMYTVQVSQPTGTTTSAPAAVAVGQQVVVSTYAGTGSAPAIDGPALSAMFSGPHGLARDTAGNLYVADTGYKIIRKITPGGTVSTFAGGALQQGSVDGAATVARFEAPSGLAIDAAGNLYVSDWNAIRKVTPAGVVSTLAGDPVQTGSVDGPGTVARFNTPAGLAVDAGGNVYVADSANDTIRKITPDGTVSTVAGTPRVEGATDGVGAAALLTTPVCLAFDPAGNLFVGCDGMAGIRKISPHGFVSTAVGLTNATAYTKDGIAANAAANDPSAIAVDGGGTVYWMENMQLRRLTPDGVVQTLAGQPGRTTYIDGAGAQAGFGTASGMVIDSSGSIYLTDQDNNRVRKVTFGPAGSGPLIAYTAPPQSHTLATGGTLVLTAPTSGEVAYGSWEKNGVAMVGATSSTLILSAVQASDSGTYTYVAGNAAGTVTSAPAVVNVSATATPGRLMNLSVRSAAGNASDTLLVGFAIAGGSATEPVLIRGVGPGLATYGVTHPLPDPTLTLHSASGVVATNDDWTAGTGSVFSSVGAFPLTAGSADAAMTAALNPGTYSAEVGNKGQSGVALAEVYDLGAVATSGPQLVNVSARSYVGTGDGVLIAGFSVLGDTSRTFLIRGVGPSLSQYGVQSYLKDPQIEVRASDNSVVAANDNWNRDASLLAAFNAVGAFPLNDSSWSDAALLVTLKPGLYTVKVSGVGNTTGVGMVEVYALP